MSRSKSEPTKEETGRYGCVCVWGGVVVLKELQLYSTGRHTHTRMQTQTHTHTQICLGKSFAANSGIRSLGHGFACAARANIKYSNTYFV